MATALIRPLVRRVGHAVLAGVAAASTIRKLHSAGEGKTHHKIKKMPAKARKKIDSILNRKPAKSKSVKPVRSKPAGKPRIIPGTPKPTKAQRSKPQGTVLNAAIKKIKSMRAPKRYTNSGKVIR